MTLRGGNTNYTWAAVDAQLRQAQDTAVFRVQAVGHGALAYQWYYGKTPIDGARGRTLTISNVRPQDAGQYSVLVSNECGATSSRPAVLPLNPKLQIFPAANTTTLIWPPDAKIVLEVAKSFNGPWTIVPNSPMPFSIGALGPGKFFRLRRVSP